MKFELVTVIFFIIGCNAAECPANIKTRITKPGNGCDKFDALAEQLIDDGLSGGEQLCLEQLLKTITNVKNATLWATWIWDSIQLPVGQLSGTKYHLGSYDQCLRETVGSSQPPFRTQYCLADLVLGSNEQSKLSPKDINPYASTEDYIGTKTKLEQSFNVITWGVCVPESCQTESVKTFLRVLLKQSHLGYLQSPVDVTVTHCEPTGETKKHMDGLYIVVFAAALSVAVGLCCTKYASRNVNSSSFATNVLHCFCIERNVKDWLRRHENDVQVLHGIKCILCCLIILTHKVLLAFTVPLYNGLDFEESSYSYRHLINSLQLAVDGFFVISGLLHVKNTKYISTLKDLFKIIVKRYFRYIWWYILTTLLIFFIIPRTGCGPLCARFMAPEYENCIKSWWLGFLMLGNYIHGAHICNPVIWYIFCDFHLTILASILLWLHHKSARVALACFSVIAALSILLPALVVYESPEIMVIEINFTIYKAFQDLASLLPLYQRTHHRAIPYLAGMAMGYILSKYRPESFKVTITKRQFMSLLAIMPLWVFLFYLSNQNFKAVMLLVTTRLVWAGLNCALIAASEYGYMPNLKKVLSCSIFVPLSRLTYGIYMIHFITMSYTWCSARSPQYVNRYILTEQFLGTILLTIMLSLFFLLFVESPLNNFVKILSSSGETKMKRLAAGGNEVKCADVSSSRERTLDEKDKML